MTIPPLVRIGSVPPRDPSSLGTRYVVLLSSGWEIVQWHDELEGMLARIPAPPTHRGSAIYPANVICWMPADGS